MLENIINITNNLFIYEELPEWYQDNPYIKDNYRPWNRSYKYYFKSLCKLHNETLNIWSHLIGFLFYIIFIGIYNSIYFEQLSDIYTKKNILITNIYAGTAATCFLCSTIMHTIYPKSYRVSCNSCNIDYIGITLLISGSYSPFIYYLFYCNHHLEIIYIILINSLALINIGISFLSFMYNSKYFRYKALIYIIYVLSVIIPITNKFIKDNYTFHLEIINDIKYYLFSIIVYFIAVMFYLTRFPERFFNIKYLYSHSLFHIFSFLASVCVLISIFEIQFQYTSLNCYNETINIFF